LAPEMIQAGEVHEAQCALTSEVSKGIYRI
jgi:hypothetical protein